MVRGGASLPLGAPGALWGGCDGGFCPPGNLGGDDAASAAGAAVFGCDLLQVAEVVVPLSSFLRSLVGGGACDFLGPQETVGVASVAAAPSPLPWSVGQESLQEEGRVESAHKFEQNAHPTQNQHTEAPSLCVRVW